jgi:hypothetical protein
MTILHDGDLLFRDGSLSLYLKHSTWTDEEYRAAMARLSRCVEAYLRTRKPHDPSHDTFPRGENPVPPRRTVPFKDNDRW